MIYKQIYAHSILIVDTPQLYYSMKIWDQGADCIHINDTLKVPLIGHLCSFYTSK